MSDTDTIKQIAVETLGSSERVMRTIKDIASHTWNSNLSKEQAAISIACVFGLVAVYAIKNKYSFAYDYQTMKISFTSPST